MSRYLLYVTQRYPGIALTHILSVCIFYFTVQENWKHLTPEIDRLSPEMVKKHTEAASKFILAAVKKTGTFAETTEWKHILLGKNYRFVKPIPQKSPTPQECYRMSQQTT